MTVVGVMVWGLGLEVFMKSILLIMKMGADTDGGINKEAGSKSKQDKKQQGTGMKNYHESTSKCGT